MNEWSHWNLTGTTQMGIELTNVTKKTDVPKWDILGMSLLGGFYIHPFLQYGGK